MLILQRSLTPLGFLDEHLGPEWLEEYAKLCVPEEVQDNFT